MSAKIFTIENRKGGVGKTTTAVTLGVGLAKKLQEQGNGRVLIIDLDPQGNVCTSLGVKSDGKCISHVLTGEGTLRDNVIPADTDKRPNLFIIPATDKLRTAKETLISQVAMSEVMKQLRGRDGETTATPIIEILTTKMEPATSIFEFIIIDCPPTLDTLQEAVHHFADAAIVPVKVDFLGTQGTAQHTQNILADQAAGIDIKIAAVVPTFVRRYKLAKQMLNDLQQFYGNLVMEPIPLTVKVEEAPASGGQTILEYAPDNPAAHAYQTLVDHIFQIRIA